MNLCKNCSPRKECFYYQNGETRTECKFYKPMTEQEYLQTCDTEQLVHVIHLMTTSCYVCGKEGVDYKRCYFHKKCTGPKEIEEWLKQPHNAKYLRSR